MTKINKLVFLNKQNDFILLKKEGKQIKQNNFFLVYRFNNLSYCRFAFLFSKKTGKAVQRNQFKRWSRHFLRENFLREKTWIVGLDLLLGLKNKEKDFYKQMNYKKICLGWKNIIQNIEY